VVDENVFLGEIAQGGGRTTVIGFVRQDRAFHAVHAVPGTIEAENFDDGGEGVAYHDNEPANQGGAFRPGEGVDLQAASEGAFNPVASMCCASSSSPAAST
jgi:hypothetical protein